MWITDPIFKNDLTLLQESGNIPWKELHGKTVFVTGATGLIGNTLTSALLHYTLQNNAGIQVMALVRDLARAQEIFSEQLADGCPLRFLVGTVEDLPNIPEPIDYVIHSACPTNSKFFVEHPVETVRAIVGGTQNILELAREKSVKGMVYLSSMEVYGQTSDRKRLGEADLGFIDLASARSSYPEGKRLAENLCCCYATQYGLPVCVARLVQTFGPGVAPNEEKVFAYMARCAKRGEDILLKTSGSKENMYLYTADAASAILILLLRGEKGKPYNVANEDTYCSVKEMAELVARTLTGGKIQVRTNVGGDSGMYRPEGYLNLDTSKLKELGWVPTINLQEMFLRMTASFD